MQRKLYHVIQEHFRGYSVKFREIGAVEGSVVSYLSFPRSRRSQGILFCFWVGGWVFGKSPDSCLHSKKYLLLTTLFSLYQDVLTLRVSMKYDIISKFPPHRVTRCSLWYHLRCRLNYILSYILSSSQSKCENLTA